MSLYPFFDWLDTSWLAAISKAYGGVFAFVQMLHLLAMALLGGMVLVANLRLLNLLMREVPADLVVRHTYAWFDRALLVLIASGIFMSSAVALKLYYNEMFWAKMIALLLGAAFTYAIRRPLFARGITNLQPFTVKAIAVASLLVWFTVAATGRWIGFS